MSKHLRALRAVAGHADMVSSPVSPMPKPPVDAGVSGSNESQRAFREGVSRSCECCGGDRQVSTAYDRWSAPCPRCDGSGLESPRIHSSLLLRNVRSGKVWAVFARYPDDWGLHRMKPSRRGHYVWQIIHRFEAELRDERRWAVAGFGDAWDHHKMESDPLASPDTHGREVAAEPEGATDGE